MANKMDNTAHINEVSRIASGTVFKGELSSPGDIRIDGTFEGNIFSNGLVVIGEKADVKGSVACTNLDNYGHHGGDIFVKDTLILRKGSTMDGDIHVKRLQVELDASFNGSCHMIDDAQFEKQTAELSGTKVPEK